jgi:hypothetical protein
MAHTDIKKPCKISTGINVADNRKMNHKYRNEGGLTLRDNNIIICTAMREV